MAIVTESAMNAPVSVVRLCNRTGTLRVIAAFLCACMCAAAQAFNAPPPPAGVSGLPAYSLHYDAARDPAADLLLARKAAAERSHNVLVMVGGDWCVWCFFLDRHFSMDAASAQTWYAGFEVLRVYYDEDNNNATFLAGFPNFEMFPHFFIVADDGRVLASVTADVMIRDAKYDPELIRRFVARWGPASHPQTN